MLRERGESDTEYFYRQPESATSSSYVSPAHRPYPQHQNQPPTLQQQQQQQRQPHADQQQQQPREPREPKPVQLPEYKVVNVKEPPKSYDNSFHCIHTSVEVVVVVSLICATSELVLGFWVLYVLSKASFHTSSSKYITIGVGMFIAQSVRVYALLTWLKSSKQELTKAYSATTLCTVVSILVLLPIGCLVLFVAIVVFEFVVFQNRPQIEVLQSFMLVAGFDLLFSICYGSIVACCFQSRLQRRQLYLRTCSINIRPPPPPPPTATTTPSTTLLSIRNQQQTHYHHHNRELFHENSADLYPHHHHHQQPIEHHQSYHYHYDGPQTFRNSSAAVAYV